MEGTAKIKKQYLDGEIEPEIWHCRIAHRIPAVLGCNDNNLIHIYRAVCQQYLNIRFAFI